MWEKTIQLAREYQTRRPLSELLREAECMAHIWLRGALVFFGEYLDARASSLQALHISQSLGKVRVEIFCLTDLAEIDFHLGDYATARQGYEKALSMACALGDPLGIAVTHRRLGELQRIKGEFAQAQVLLEQATTTAHKSALFYDEAWALAALLRLHCQLGNHEGAHTCHIQLHQLMVERELTQDCQAQGLLAFAVHALFTQDYHQALADAQQGRQLAEQSDNSNNRADAAVILGHACVAAKQWTDAAQAYQQAIVIYQQLGNAPLQVEPYAGLANVALAQGQVPQALALVDTILPVLAERPYGRVNTPFYAYLVCHRVLMATQDPRATVMLQTAHSLLQSCAAHIGEDAAQRSFLECVAAHRELSQAYHQIGDAADNLWFNG
jgi:tetratricopeptide (TPR) repeat protein